MKKHHLIVICSFLLVCVIVSYKLENNVNSDNLEGTNKDICNIETDDFAIYLSSIIETNPIETNKYVHYMKKINIQFPQIYYSNDYNDYDIDIETQINKTLFALSINGEDSFLFNRDTRDLIEYSSHYTITKWNEDILSIKYYGYLCSISRAKEFCYGVTINTKTGEEEEISKYVQIDEELVNNVENGSIKYYSSPEYDKAYVVAMVEGFVMNYDILSNKNNMFFISEKLVNLIIPVLQGNGNYIILELKL